MSSPDEAPRRGCFARLLIRLSLLAASTLLALVVAEVAVRVAGKGIPPRAEAARSTLGRKVPESEIPGIRYVLDPGKTQKAVYPGAGGEPDREIVYRINRHGFRDGNYPKEKADGVYRIVVLGDSFTYGTGINLEDTYPELMEERFFPAFAEGMRVEVLNWGVYAYNTRQEIALLRHRVAEFDPDLVLLMAYINDASGEDRAERDGGAQKKEVPWEVRWIERLGLTSGVYEGDRRTPAQRRTMSLRRASRLVDLVAHKVYGKLRARVSIRNYQDDWTEGSAGLEMVSKGFRDLAELSRQHGFAVHVSMYPDLNQLDDGYPFRAAHATVAQLATRESFVYHDLFPLLEGYDGATLHAHAHDKHPNGYCNALVGELLAKALVPWVKGERR